MPRVAEKVYSLGASVLGRIKSFQVSQGPQSVTFTPADPGRSSDVVVKYRDSRSIVIATDAVIFDPIVDVYERLGFSLEGIGLDQLDVARLRKLKDTDAQELRDETWKSGIRTSYHWGLEKIWLGGPHLEQPSGFVEVSRSMLNWRWKPWLAVFREKGLEFREPAEDGSEDAATAGTGNRLVLMHYKDS